MKNVIWPAVAFAAAAGIGGLVVASRESDPAFDREFRVRGVVVAAPVDRVVQIAHEAIPDYMPAMTMPFTVGRGEAMPALSPGDRITFALRLAEDRSWIAGIEVVGRGPVPAPIGSPAGSAARRLKPGDAVPAFRLVDQASRAVTEADLQGRMTLVTFIFTRCPLPEFCPLVVQRVREIQDTTAADQALARRLHFLSVTLDPGFDTPAVLAAYAQAKGADLARWRFVTGTAADVGVLTRAFAVHAEQNGVTIDHTLATALVDESGRVVEIWRGTYWKTSEVVSAIRAALGS